MANQMKKGPKLPVQQLTILGENEPLSIPSITTANTRLPSHSCCQVR